VVIADWSLTMLAAARGRAELRCAADLRCLPFPDASFTGVHAAYAIQNVSEWRHAIAECVRVSEPDAPIVVAWGGPPGDERLAGIEGAFFEALGDAAGARAQSTGITVDAANEVFEKLGKPLRRVFTIQGTQTRTPRQIAERARLNPYRSRAESADRDRATEAALSWAAEHVGPVDAPVSFRVRPGAPQPGTATLSHRRSRRPGLPAI
jgi:SAM-dependent methyltransferase